VEAVDRVDALGKAPKHLNWLAPAHLRESEDEDLQRVVREAARELGCPIALVSLVLENIQFFKAHYGLPTDLKIARATDRDVSFCQFVVRDGAAFEVNDAASDNRVPQDLVKRYGIQAYLGFPIATAGHVVGSLCVLDTRPRKFEKSDLENMERLAALVSRRLDDMRSTRVLPSGALTAEASVPVFAELRNLLMPLSLGFQSLAISTAELGPVFRLARATVSRMPENDRVMGSLADAGLSVDDMVGLVADLQGATNRLSDLLIALEKGTLMTGGYVLAGEVLDAGALLADHLIRNIGGLQTRGRSERRLRVARPTAVMAVSGLLTLLARAIPVELETSGVVAEIADTDDFVGVTFSAQNAPKATYTDVERRFASLIAGDEHALRVRSDALGVTLLLGTRA
jgi:GAF domain